MHKFYSRFLLLITLTCSVSMSNAEPMRVYDKGLDGNERIFVVHCPNGNRNSITVTFQNEPTPKIVKVCVYPFQGEKTCRKNAWNIDDAAEFSCK